MRIKCLTLMKCYFVKLRPNRSPIDKIHRNKKILELFSDLKTGLKSPNWTILMRSMYQLYQFDTGNVGDGGHVGC